MASVKLKSCFYYGLKSYAGLLGLIRKHYVKENSYISVRLKSYQSRSLSKYYASKGARPLSINTLMSSPLKVLFFGTDDFSVESLKALVQDLNYGEPKHLCQLDVCTTKSKVNPVRAFASSHQLRVLDWPPHIRNREYDVGLVVSFGQLIPGHMIDSFRFGMLNVHASLLPRWRGAAPIIYAVLNGDTETGITIMQIKPKKFDIGNIVKQEKCSISHHELMPDLSSRLSKLGASLLLQSLRDLPQSIRESKEQPETNVTYAPRVTSALSRVNWQQMDSTQVFNLSRALHGLYTLTSSWCGQKVKLLAPSLVQQSTDSQTSSSEPGQVELHRQTMTLRVLCSDKKMVSFSSIIVAGKRPMKPLDFYNGYISKCEESKRRFT